MKGFCKGTMLSLPMAVLLTACALAATDDFSRYVPDSTLVFASWNMTGDALKDYKASQLARFLDDKEVKELLGKAPLKRLLRLDLTFDDLAPFVYGRFALTVLKSEMVKTGEGDRKREEVLAHSAALFDVSGEKAKALAKTIVGIFDNRSREKNLGKKTVEHLGVKITVYDRPKGALEKDACFILKDLFVVASTEEAAKGLVEALQKGLDKPLSKSAAFQAAQEKVGDRAFMWYFINTLAISKRAGKARKISLPFGKMMDGLAVATGADKIQSVALSVSSNKEGLATNLHLLGVDPKAPFMQAIAGRTGAYKCMELVPADVQSFVAMSVKPSEVWTIVQKFLADKDVGPFAGRMKALAEKEKKGGFDFEKDFIENLGEEALLITPPSVKNGGMTAPTIVLPVKDRAKIEKVALALFRVKDEKPVETKHDGHTIYSFVKRSFACTDKYLIFGRNVDAIKAVLNAVGGAKNLMKDNEEFKKAVAALGGETSLLARIRVERLSPLFMALMMFNVVKPDLEEARQGGVEDAPEREEPWDDEEDEEAEEDEPEAESPPPGKGKNGGKPPAVDEEWPEMPKIPDSPIFKQLKLFEKFNQHFKYIYMAAIPGKDGLTVRILIR